MKCIICERRPAKGGAYCANCSAKIDAEQRRRSANKPLRFLTYRGYVVGLYRNGSGKLIPHLLRRSPKWLPKSRTLDLNTYLEGFTRDQVKKMKACVLHLANG